MSETHPSAAAHRPTLHRLALHATLVVTAAACGGKAEAPTPATDPAATAGAAAAPGAAGGTAGSAAANAADSASSAIVTQSAPPTKQDRAIAVPDSAHGAHAGDTNHSGMTVKPGGTPKDSH